MSYLHQLVSVGLRELHQAVGDAVRAIELHDFVVIKEREDLPTEHFLGVRVRPKTHHCGLGTNTVDELDGQADQPRDVRVG